jgi:YbbR domain-containing protein
MMERLREAKWVYVLLSILLAVLFWMYVRSALDPSQTSTYRNVKVEVTGTSVLARQGLTVVELSDDTVDLYLEAPVSVWSTLNRYRDDFWVTLDVSKCVEGENKVSYTPNYPANVNQSSITLQERTPDTITVIVEKLDTQTFDVEFQMVGKVADGYQAGTAAISPETVTVSGAAEQVSRVSKVVAILETEELDQQFAGDLPLTLLDAEGNVLTDLDVTLDATTAYVVLPVVVVKEIPLTVNFVYGGGVNSEENFSYEIEPKSIMVSGTEADLQNLTELSLGSVNLADVVGSKTIPMQISLDPSLENLSGVVSANVSVTISGLSARTFEVDNIQLANQPAGYTMDVITQVKSVTVRGLPEDLDTVEASLIRIVADMSDFTNEGTYSVPARVYLDANSAVGVIGEYFISVRISR